MKKRIKFYGLYFGLIIIFMLRYFITIVIKEYETRMWESFNLKAAWLGYLRNGVDVLYYFITFIILIFLATAKGFKGKLETIIFILPAGILIIPSIIMINPFSYIYMNSTYCIPFGAVLLSAFVYRIFYNKMLLKQ